MHISKAIHNSKLEFTQSYPHDSSMMNIINLVHLLNNNNNHELIMWHHHFHMCIMPQSWCMTSLQQDSQEIRGAMNIH